MALSPMGDRQDQTAAAKETTASGIPMYFFFAPKYLDNRPQNTSVNLDKLCFSSFSWSEIMQYFRFLKVIKTLGTQSVQSQLTQLKKKTLACYGCQCFVKERKMAIFFQGG